MSLYRQPKSPYWYVRFTVGGVKVRRGTRTTSRAAAEEYESKLRTEQWRQHNLGQRPVYTWAEAVQRWYAEADGRGKEHDSDRLKWFAQYLDTTPIAAIDRDLIEQMRSLRCGESSPSTANRYMALVRMILRKAHREWDWIDKVPVVPMYRLEASEPRYLTRAQYEKLKKKLPEHLKPVADFSIETGLRMRNVTGLQWSQVDLKRKLVVIPASRAKAGETIAVPLSVVAVQVLKAQKGKHAVRVFTYHHGGGRGPVEGFEDANGAVFKAAAAAAGVPWLRWHDLRHTWASWHIQGGTPPHVLQLLGGWKSMAMVQRYAYLGTDHLRAFVEHKKGIPRKRA